MVPFTHVNKIRLPDKPLTKQNTSSCSCRGARRQEGGVSTPPARKTETPPSWLVQCSVRQHSFVRSTLAGYVTAKLHKCNRPAEDSAHSHHRRRETTVGCRYHRIVQESRRLLREMLRTSTSAFRMRSVSSLFSLFIVKTKRREGERKI